MTKLASQKVYNEKFVDMAKAGGDMLKEAAAGATTYTRKTLREDSFFEKLITPVNIDNDELDKSENPELLVKWFDREPDTAPAAVVPIGVVPAGYQFRGTRYPVYHSRVMSPLFMQDLDLLRGYDYDIRKVMLEISTKDLATVVDTKGMELLSSNIGTLNTANPLNGMGLPQNVSIPGGINRANVAEMFKVMQRLKVPFGPMQPDGGESKGIMLMNNITAMDFLKLERGEIGGDLAQQQFVEGLPSEKLLGVKPVYTIKSDLIPEGVVWLLSAEEFLGRYTRLMPLTVFMETKATFLSFFQYMNIGMSIGNIRGFAKITFS